MMWGVKEGRVCDLVSTMVGLMSKGRFASWICSRRRPKVAGWGMEEVESAGFEYKLLKEISVNDEHPRLGQLPKEVKQHDVCSEVFKLLDSKDTNIVALYGVRGIGKSTLLKRLEEDAKKKKFSIILRLDGTALANGRGDLRDKLYDAFITKYGLIDHEDMPTQSRDKPYLLLVDDLLKPLSKIGLIFPFKNVGKIVFTTEEQDMSGQVLEEHDMNYQVLKVLPLDARESWELFNEEIEKNSVIFSDPSKNHLVKDMVEECHGLPLALKILAGAVKNWEKPLDELKEVAIQLDNPNSLLTFIKFVLNSLPVHQVTECFLYTSMFPNRYCISEESLIEYWIGEGFFYSNESSQPDSSICEANMDAGQQVIEKLKSLNLVEECAITEDHVGKSLKVLDSLRKVILNEHSEMFVQSGLRLKQAPDGKMWKNSKRISLMSNEIAQLKERHKSCRNLITFLVNQNCKLVVHRSFFAGMPHVRVLDLSYTLLKELPKSIGTMVSLQYLNLSFTSIQSLPKELGKLTRLRCLKLDRTGELQSIPSQLLSKFADLQIFSIIDGAFHLSEHNEYLLKEMKGLKDLGLVKIAIRNMGLFNKLCKIEEMVLSVVHLQMIECPKEEKIDLFLLFGLMENLRYLIIGCFLDLREIVVGGEGIENNLLSVALENLTISGQRKLETFSVNGTSLQFFHNLRTLNIYSCRLLRDVSWVKYLPNLVHLALVGNSMMDNLFVDDKEGWEDVFPKLKNLTLSQLHGLKYICGLVKFPCLETLTIFVCPNLRELPHNLYSGDTKKIKCDRKWWEVFSKEMSTKENSINCSLIPHFVNGIGIIY